MAEIIGEESHVLRPLSALHCTILYCSTQWVWTNVGGHQLEKYVQLKLVRY